MTAQSVKLYTLNYSEMRTYLFALLFIVGNIVLPQADYDELASYMGEVSGAFFYTKETSFLRNMDAYLSGEASYEEAAQAAERQLNIYLSE